MKIVISHESGMQSISVNYDLSKFKIKVGEFAEQPLDEFIANILEKLKDLERIKLIDGQFQETDFGIISEQTLAEIAEIEKELG